MEHALLVGVEFTAPARAGGGRPAAAGFGLEESLEELQDLAQNAGAAIVGRLLQRRLRPDAGLLIGAGKLRELQLEVERTHADLVLFDTDLSPTQQRNLERAAGVRVVSRTQLILDIFARHARTREGQLQVELAQLEYLLPQLAGHGVAMSRLGGGIGTRGPGETKLETDRRRIHRRIAAVRTALERVRTQRGEQRRLRESVPLATLALVGYTNAGKSSLLNRLAGAGVLTSARMFATLDPTIRSLQLPSRRQVLLADTVGFLRQLPHGLINAFRATLEEVTRANLLVIVSDANAPYREEQETQVQTVLQELRVETTPRVQVWNKADLLPPERFRQLTAAAAEATVPTVLVSAHDGRGLPELLAALDHHLPADALQEVQLLLPQPAGKTMHLLHERGEILSQRYHPQSVELTARVPASLLPQLQPFRRL